MKNKNTQTKKLNSKKQKPAKVKLFSRQPKIKKPKIARKDRFTKRNFMRLLSESMVSKNWYLHNFDKLTTEFKDSAFPVSKKTIFKLNSISKTFSNPMKQTSFNVFKNVSLTIEPKDVVSIVGANGAGKSTLLDIILGFKKPTSGQIDYGIVFESSPTEKIGISYQKNIFLDTLSIWDYISFTYKIYHSQISLFQVVMFVHALGLESFVKSKVNSLSGGQQQRLNILLSLFHNPEVLMFDELSNNLDVNIKDKVLNFIKTYIECKNVTCILISHDPKEIAALSNRIVLLKNKRVVLNAPTSLILHKYKTIGKFLEQNI